MRRRILIIDDNERIFEDYSKILSSSSTEADNSSLDELESGLFDDEPAEAPAAPNATANNEVSYEIDFANQGKLGFEKAVAANQEENPYQLIFVDMRMPPGWDGLETIQNIWREVPDSEVVLCTAYSDHSWKDIVAGVGTTDQLVFLKKPFEPAEVQQLALALTTKFETKRENRRHMSNLEHLVEEKTKEVESQKLKLWNQDKLASLGEMAGGIAHEINNPLAIIEGNTRIIASRVKQNMTDEEFAQFHKRVEKVGATTKRIKSIIDSLLRIAHGGSSNQFRHVKLDSVVNDVVNLSQTHGDSKSVSITSSVETDCELFCDQTQLCQILLNLVKNAIDAIEEQEGDRWIRIEGTADAQQTEIRVSNSGPRIARELETRIFDPFFTTKEVGRGTGLGLSLAKTMIEAHNGELSLSDAEHTTFVIRIPHGQERSAAS